jgi:arylsulfatase A-like enzyme
MPRGKATEHVAELLDMYPTLVDLCGLPQPAHGLQGRSLAPLLRDPKARWEDHAFSVSGNPEKGVRRSVRTAQYRYVEQPNDQPAELYYYENDPWERNNLAGEAELADVQNRLAALLAQDRS